MNQLIPLWFFEIMIILTYLSFIPSIVVLTIFGIEKARGYKKKSKEFIDYGLKKLFRNTTISLAILSILYVFKYIYYSV